MEDGLTYVLLQLDNQKQLEKTKLKKATDDLLKYLLSNVKTEADNKETKYVSNVSNSVRLEHNTDMNNISVMSKGTRIESSQTIIPVCFHSNWSIECHSYFIDCR